MAAQRTRRPAPPGRCWPRSRRPPLHTTGGRLPRPAGPRAGRRAGHRPRPAAGAGAGPAGVPGRPPDHQPGRHRGRAVADLDEKAAANNLRVTLTYLLRLLEPWRSARESAYFVRFEGQAVALVTGERLRIDLDQFDDHVAQAARAEADGTPSLALGHHLAAVELYRGELHEGVPGRRVADAGARALPEPVRGRGHPGRASCWWAGATPTRPSRWPAGRSRSTRGPRRRTGCWWRWPWPAATRRRPPGARPVPGGPGRPRRRALGRDEPPAPPRASWTHRRQRRKLRMWATWPWVGSRRT